MFLMNTFLQSGWATEWIDHDGDGRIILALPKYSRPDFTYIDSVIFQRIGDPILSILDTDKYVLEYRLDWDTCIHFEGSVVEIYN